MAGMSTAVYNETLTAARETSMPLSEGSASWLISTFSLFEDKVLPRWENSCNVYYIYTYTYIHIHIHVYCDIYIVGLTKMKEAVCHQCWNMPGLTKDVSLAYTLYNPIWRTNQTEHTGIVSPVEFARGCEWRLYLLHLQMPQALADCTLHAHNSQHWR